MLGTVRVVRAIPVIRRPGVANVTIASLSSRKEGRVVVGGSFLEGDKGRLCSRSAEPPSRAGPGSYQARQPISRAHPRPFRPFGGGCHAAGCWGGSGGGMHEHQALLANAIWRHRGLAASTKGQSAGSLAPFKIRPGPPKIRVRSPNHISSCHATLIN